MPIAYDPSVDALFHPELRDTLFVAGQSVSRLQLAVEAARLAYYRAEESTAQHQRLVDALQRVGLAHFQHFNCGGTQAFGAFRPSDGLALVALRGTQPDTFTDLLTDLRFLPVPWTPPGTQVHQGFAAAWGPVHLDIEKWLQTACPGRQHLLVCGHSLGGALATLMAPLLGAQQLVTLGCPRVGNAAFVATLAGLDVTRLVHCCDKVPRLPPELFHYSHPEPALLIDHTGQLQPDASEAFASADRAQGRVQFLAQTLGRSGNVLLRELADHAPINYARAFFD